VDLEEGAFRGTKTHNTCSQEKPMPRNALVTTAGIIALATPAFSAVINSGASGLAAPERVVTFSEFTFAEDTPISTEFSSLGVTFSPSLYYRITSAWETAGINGINLRSGNIAGDILVQDISIRLDTPVLGAAFASIASPFANATITARLGGVDVESFTTEINLNDTSWYGFTGIALDEIAISYPEVTRIRIDNVQLGAVVPEPNTLILASLGGLLVPGFRRRRRR
jgi:hypothetical protein